MSYQYVTVNTPIESEPYAPWNLGHICEIDLKTRKLMVYPVIFEDPNKYIYLKWNNVPCESTKINTTYGWSEHRTFTSYDAYLNYKSEHKSEWPKVKIFVPKKHTRTYAEILKGCSPVSPYDGAIKTTNDSIAGYKRTIDSAERCIKNYIDSKERAKKELKEAEERLHMLEEKKKQYELSKATEISTKDYNNDNGVITTNA